MSILLALSSTRVFSPRLLELERVLARDRDASVRAERIRHYTAALRSSHSPDMNNDDVDLLTMRLLLDEFVIAVRHLRGVTDMAAITVDTAAKPVHESQKFIKREEKRQERKRLAATPATDRP